MGFERLCMVLQGKKSNYDTDVFQNIINELGNLCNTKYGVNDKSDVAMRVVADHLRAVSFAIADGQLPSNNKAGYVIRRILRRSVRYGYTFLGFREAFMWRLIEELKNTMGETFPELGAQQQLIEKVIREEEESFLRTLSTGIRLMDDIMKKIQLEGKRTIAGSDAFELYDTFGFPLDLTELIAREHGLSVDVEGFAAEMENQKNRSRNAATLETDDWVELVKIDETEFVGYDVLSADIRIARYRKIINKQKTLFQLVFDRTPFYGESGGQVGDTGYIEANGEKTAIVDTKKENNLIVHIVEQLPSNPGVGFRAVVDLDKRISTANNHSATHLLHHALRQVLGTHVEQKGSLVNSDHLRFDFSHFQKMEDEEIEKVERLVNEKIRENLYLDEKRAVPIAEAKAMGAMSLFGEKYGDNVRVIRFGESVEFCGGTHVAATGQIGLFRIVSESAIAAGIRRIEAITGAHAESFDNDQIKTLKNIREILKGSKDILGSVMNLVEANAELSKKIEAFAKENLKIVKSNLKSKMLVENGVSIIAGEVEVDNAAMLKDLCYQLKNEVENLFLVLGAVIDGRPNLSVMISENLVAEKNLNAALIVREAGKEIKGGGGGQPFYATAGGKEPSGMSTAIEKALTFL
jgi:alanyl-tRNA synthetase